ncbi:hypothetical protein Poli38472_013601 [Pythium oligandrum]|uniref:IgA peptidase M64 n=1 Tax=Pythium oligandrum TaxID=41045 RepID=A0A8K1FJW4_PYTOL|nr:hypothetical protein Poli38472_013601 [Pythium oligandrum]|eukprot:TMW61138.1 hypothetical protein Poli38472_013601 [Pythium oligandrum]
MKIAALVSALALSAHAANAVSTYSAKVLIDNATSLCTLITPTGEAQQHRAIQKDSDVVEYIRNRQNRLPEEVLVGEEEGLQQFVEIVGGSALAVDQRILERCKNGLRTNPDLVQEKTLLRTNAAPEATAITRKLVDSGNPLNRIDVVFMGDGYTSAEQDKFFQDMQRLTDDMFGGETFAQYLPLFNIWAAYLPSVQSGIGTGGSPRNTAFQLYRDGTELRGVYTANPSAARSVCTGMGTGACDFPSIIGNDDFYGGLGGEFVISTSSKTSGTIVLRHEMGHNFGDVGEEYDGGQVYRGANAASSISAVSWKHWLTEPSKLVEQQMVQLYQKHIWYDLKQGAYTISFTSTGTYKRWFLQFSVSGTDTDDSLTVTLDGKPLAWKSNGLKDRSFYQWRSETSGFTKGTHTLVVKAGGPFDSAIIKQLCNAVIYEYMDEATMKLDDPDYIGIYPTWDINKRKTYRPDNERCLMRNMSSPVFCRVCQENMWQKFLARIEFIDDVVVSNRVATLKLIPLAQLRTKNDTFPTLNPEVAKQEKYSVTWLKSGSELTQFRDAFSANLTAGTYTVRVTFSTPNVRNDPKKYMQSEKTFTVV